MSAAHAEGHLPTREEILRATDRPLPRTLKLTATVLAVLGALVFVIGLFAAPDRVWRAFHANWLYFASTSSGAAMFVAVQRLTTARWSRPIIRFFEGYAAFLPVAWVFLLLSLTVGASHIFPWTQVRPPVPEKVFWLNQPLLAVRNLIWFGIISALSVWFVYTAVRLDVGGSPEGGAAWARGIRERMRRGFAGERREIHSTHSRQGKIAAVLAVVFGFGWMALFYDLSMALDMHFFSTLYGWWGFMSAWLAALVTGSLLVMWWRRYLNTYDLITEEHFHDLGKLCFAFTAFWGYLTFDQLLIIWYGNLPEETNFFRQRLLAPWKGMTFSVLMLVFVAPFPGLMSRAAKVFLPTFILFAACSTIGLWMQRYIEVYPSTYGQPAGLPFGIWEIGVTLLYLGVWGLCYIAFMDAFPRMRVTLMTSPHRDEVQVPVDPRTMEPLPAHE
jgi:hypothetical protein